MWRVLWCGGEVVCMCGGCGGVGVRWCVGVAGVGVRWCTALVLGVWRILM